MGLTVLLISVVTLALLKFFYVVNRETIKTTNSHVLPNTCVYPTTCFGNDSSPSSV